MIKGTVKGRGGKKVLVLNKPLSQPIRRNKRTAKSKSHRVLPSIATGS